MATSQLESEIDEQPAALARLLAERRAAVEAAAARIARFAPAWVVIAARGSSDNAARYAQYLLGAHNQLGVALAVPSLVTRYGAAPRLERALTLGISLSGQSPDVVAVVEEARRQGGATLAVTGDPDSPLARAAELTLLLACGEEQAVAATKSYTNQLCLLAMLSVALEGGRVDRWAALAAVPDAVREVMRLEASGTAEKVATAERFAVLGRGFHYATAFELALKMKETSYVAAEASSTADFLHGPIAMVEAGFPVVLIAPTGRTPEDPGRLLDLLEERGAHSIVLSDREDLLSRARGRLPVPAGVPEWLSPMVSVVAAQRFAVALVRARGLDPDRPRGLLKVTRTR